MENMQWKKLQKVIPVWKDCLRLHRQTPFAVVSPARGLEYSGVWRLGTRCGSFLSWSPALCHSLHQLILHAMFQDQLGISMLANMLAFTVAFHHGDERPFKVEKTTVCPVFDDIVEAAASTSPTSLRTRMKRTVSTHRDAPGALHMSFDALFIDHLARTVAFNEADRSLGERKDLYDRPVKVLSHEALATLTAAIDSFGTSFGSNRFPMLLSVDVSYEMSMSIKRKRGHPSSSDAIIEMHANGFLAELRRNRRVAGPEKAPSPDGEISIEAGDVEISGDAAVAVSQNSDHDEDMPLVNPYDDDEHTGVVTMSQQDEAAPIIEDGGGTEPIPHETPHEVVEDRGRDEAPLSFGPVAPESNGRVEESRSTIQNRRHRKGRREGKAKARAEAEAEANANADSPATAERPVEREETQSQPDPLLIRAIVPAGSMQVQTSVSPSGATSINITGASQLLGPTMQVDHSTGVSVQKNVQGALGRMLSLTSTTEPLTSIAAELSVSTWDQSVLLGCTPAPSVSMRERWLLCSRSCSRWYSEHAHQTSPASAPSPRTDGRGRFPARKCAQPARGVPDQHPGGFIRPWR